MSDALITWLAGLGAVVGGLVAVWYVMTQRGDTQDMIGHDEDEGGSVSFSMTDDHAGE
ncbi:MAG: hypothetical protein AAF668_17050 [Pseudomonadota bacterium]